MNRKDDVTNRKDDVTNRKDDVTNRNELDLGNYPQNEEAANTFLNMYVTGSCLYIVLMLFGRRAAPSLPNVTNYDRNYDFEEPDYDFEEEPDYDFIKVYELN